MALYFIKCIKMYSLPGICVVYTNNSIVLKESLICFTGMMPPKIYSFHCAPLHYKLYSPFTVLYATSIDFPSCFRNPLMISPNLPSPSGSAITCMSVSRMRGTLLRNSTDECMFTSPLGF